MRSLVLLGTALLAQALVPGAGGAQSRLEYPPLGWHDVVCGWTSSHR